MEDGLVCTILACSAAVCYQEEEEKQIKNKYGAHVVTANALHENDLHSFQRYLQMSSDVYEVRIVTRSEYN